MLLIHIMIVFYNSHHIFLLKKIKNGYKEKGNNVQYPSSHNILFLLFQSSRNLFSLLLQSSRNLLLFFFVTLPNQMLMSLLLSRSFSVPTLPPRSFTVNCCHLCRTVSMFLHSTGFIVDKRMKF